MARMSVIPFSLVLAACASFAAHAQSSIACDWTNPTYNPTQAIHVFGSGGSGTDHIDSTDGTVHVADTSGCPTGDGDREFGVGGGAFPQIGTSGCLLPNGHHASGQGAGFVAHDNLFALQYRVGTDGQSPLLAASGPTACTGNGVISSDYNTDPYDCYSGQTGNTVTGQIATLGHNAWDGTSSVPWAPGNADPNGGDCEGVDGLAWVVLLVNPGSVPTQGIIYG
jgi:hypothetical protein